MSNLQKMKEVAKKAMEQGNFTVENVRNDLQEIRKQSHDTYLIPKDVIKAHRGTVLFIKGKQYKVENGMIRDELNCLRSFEEKEQNKLFKEVKGE